MPYTRNLKLTKAKLKDQNLNTQFSHVSHQDSVLRDLEVFLNTGNFGEQAYLLDALPELIGGGDSDYKDFWDKAALLYQSYPRQVTPEFHRTHFIPFFVDLNGVETVTNAHHVYVVNPAGPSTLIFDGTGMVPYEKFTVINLSENLVTLVSEDVGIITSLGKGKAEIITQASSPSIPAEWAVVFSGQKQYDIGSPYQNGTPELTSAEAGFTVVRGVVTPYQTADGAWRLRGNINVTVTGSTNFTMTLSGVTFKTGSDQTGAMFADGTTPANNLLFSQATGDIVLDTSASSSAFHISFDVEIDTSPIWMD